MTTEAKKNMLERRIAKLKGSEKNIKCPGVLRKLNRKLRNLEEE